MGTFNGELDFKVSQGELKEVTVQLTSQTGGVISGTVTFPDGVTPVYNATVLLSYVSDEGLVPITFEFTDIYGSFMFGIKNTSLDYHITIVYNEQSTPLASS